MPYPVVLLEIILPNALFITFPVSDGDVSRRPDNMQQPPASVREVNWHRKMATDEKHSCRWRNLIGRGIAKMLNKPDKDKYCLKSWPEGYCMFDHNKGPRDNIRHDLYLYGSKNVLRFRSPAEFIPHGYWLLTDPTLTKSNCGCKYCGGGGKKSQTEISEALGLPTNRGSVAPRMRAGALSKPIKKLQKGAAPVSVSLPSDSPWIAPSLRQHPGPTDGWHLKSTKLTFASSNTRISDLTSSRRFRIGELVWYPFEEEKGNIFNRPFWPYWPAIVVDVTLHAEAEVFDTGNGVYSVIQTQRYWLLRLGALSEEDRAQFEYLIDEVDMLPWHALPSAEVNFTTMEPNEQTAAFFLGFHTAKRLILSWAVFNRHHIKIEESFSDSKHPSFDRLPSSQATFESKSYSEKAGRQTTPVSSLSSTLFDRDVSQRSPSRLASPRKRDLFPAFEQVPTPYFITEPQPSTVSRAKLTEVRYEGLWYGAERIWIGDTIRLCPEREAFSDSLKASWENQPCPAPSLGADTRGVLMRIDKIYVAVNESGKKECAIAGQLYEVAVGDDLRDPEVEALYKRVTSPAVSEHITSIRPWNMPPIPSISSGQASFCTPPSPFPLPPAPSGYTLKPLLPSNTEFSVPLSFVAGRYYPDILQWPPDLLLRCTSSDNASSEPTTQECIHSLCGLAPGRLNPAICIDISFAHRTKMVEDAAEYARAQLVSTNETMEVD